MRAQGVAVATTLAMLAFAGNSLLCRLALKTASIDAASFTAIRLASGALVLWLIIAGRRQKLLGDWGSALALFGYAAAFSYAYLALPAGAGALLLFGAVQATMISRGLAMGERLLARQWLGLLLALGGLIMLLLPGVAAPAPLGSLLMIAAGVAWGVYSLRGRRAGDPTAVTAGNFVRAVPLALALALAAVIFFQLQWDLRGALYAVASGALTSGAGYAIWYAALPSLKATAAATVQLSVPVIAAVGGVVLLSEPVSWRLVVSAGAVLGGSDW